jgi:hypothetical protein
VADEPPGGRRRGTLVVVGALALAGIAVGAILLSGGGSGHHVPPPSTTTVPGAPTTTSTSTPPATTTTASGPAPAGPAAQPPPARELFGANVNRLFNDRSYSPAAIGGQLAALRATGATVARSDALWELAEPSAPVGGVHRYDWSFDDAIAGSLAAHGLTWLPIIDYSAPWTASLARADHSPPTSASDYASFAAALASRYGPQGTFWRAHPELTATPVDTYEIWNEPDNPTFWRPAPDARRYVELYLRARDAITAVDPQSRVIVGGLTNPVGFVPALLAARPDLRGHLDGVAIHPYGFPVGGVLARVRSARRALRAAGLGTVPLYATEFGWTIHPTGALDFLAAPQRPSAIERTVGDLGHLDCGVAAAILYTWVTPERNPADGADWFGIHPPAGGSSPDTAAFARGLRRASGSAPPISLCGGA